MTNKTKTNYQFGYDNDLSNDREFNMQIGRIQFHLDQLKSETELSKAIKELIKISEKFKSKTIIYEK